MEKQKFEEEWKDAFDKAEVHPSENLWTNIELSLEKTEAGKMKGRLLFYKLMAAASILFAMCVAGAAMYFYSIRNDGLNDRMASGKSSLNEVQKLRELEKKDHNLQESNDGGLKKKNERAGIEAGLLNAQQKKVNTGRIHVEVSSDAEYQGTDSPEQLTKPVNAKSSIDQRNALHVDGVNNVAVIKSTNVTPDFQDVHMNEEFPIQTRLTERRLPPIVDPKNIKLILPEQDPVAVMMAKLELRERELMGVEKENRKEKRKESMRKGERLWTSVGFATGSFNTINQNSSASTANSVASNSVTANQTKASGTSYSLGMNIGTKLSERWILQGGVNYLSQNSTYEASSVVGNPSLLNAQYEAVNSLSSKSTQSQASKLVAEVPYNVDNSLRFVSVPVQAGYMVINHALGLQLNGGVSTDVFLQNTLSPQSGSQPRVTQSSGDASPYRPVNFSGLLGTEISYRFSKHYRLALNPGIRYPFNSIYKSETGIMATPMTFDVGMRFRYIFR